MKKRFNFKDYYVSIERTLNEINIHREKVTPEFLVKTYHELREKIREYNLALERYDISMKVNALNERFRAYNEFKDRFKYNKKQIKQELNRLGIKVKPGTCLSKLLRQDYLPYPENLKNKQ